MKKIKHLIIIGLILMINISNVFAKETDTVDFTKEGSITVTLLEETEKEPIEGAEITLYKIAIAKEENHQLRLKPIDELTICNLELNDLSSQNLINDIEACIIDKEIPKYKEVTNSYGRVKFDNLELGLYLVKQTNKQKGYSTFDSFLTIIPQEIENIWTYDIESIPKTEIIKTMDLTVKKVWNNNFNKISEHVKINLLRGEEVIDTVKLSEENDWTHTWIDIPKSDEYNVIEIDIPKDYQATYRFENNIFTVTNTNKLVQTGNNTLLISLLSFIGIIFITIGIILEKRNIYE